MTVSFPCDIVDYEAVIPFKNRLLETAWTNFKAGERKDLRPAYDEFCTQQKHWLEDYALFRALKAKYQRRLLPRLAGRIGAAQARTLWPVHAESWPIRLTRSALRNSCFSARAINLSSTRIPEVCA